MRSYDEYCAIAKSLDVVGDRWTLLIVRELALRGACRYTDVRNGLPGIASPPVLEDLIRWGLGGRDSRAGESRARVSEPRSYISSEASAGSRPSGRAHPREA